ncbi:MAG: hypothetical protein OXJ52_08995 [Oligoflexia bacterium]|nr:hypothetical protein [Oligoflexia bacterium]
MLSFLFAFTTLKNYKYNVEMSYEKKIICLANSRKMFGRCIAGKEKINGQYGQWIGPVSDREKEEISEKEKSFLMAIVLKF